MLPFYINLTKLLFVSVITVSQILFTCLYLSYLIGRTLRTRLQFMPRAERVPRLSCERRNPVLASSGSREGEILELRSSLPSLRDHREAGGPGAESEHPGWEGGRGPALCTRSFPGAPASRLRAPRPARRCALRPPSPSPQRTWRSEPCSERGESPWHPPPATRGDQRERPVGAWVG